MVKNYVREKSNVDADAADDKTSDVDDVTTSDVDVEMTFDKSSDVTAEKHSDSGAEMTSDFDVDIVVGRRLEGRQFALPMDSSVEPLDEESSSPDEFTEPTAAAETDPVGEAPSDSAVDTQVEPWNDEAPSSKSASESPEDDLGRSQEEEAIVRLEEMDSPPADEVTTSVNDVTSETGERAEQAERADTAVVPAEQLSTEDIVYVESATVDNVTAEINGEQPDNMTSSDTSVVPVEQAPTDHVVDVEIVTVGNEIVQINGEFGREQSDNVTSTDTSVVPVEQASFNDIVDIETAQIRVTDSQYAIKPLADEPGIFDSRQNGRESLQEEPPVAYNSYGIGVSYVQSMKRWKTENKFPKFPEDETRPQSAQTEQAKSPKKDKKREKRSLVNCSIYSHLKQQFVDVIHVSAFRAMTWYPVSFV